MYMKKERKMLRSGWDLNPCLLNVSGTALTIELLKFLGILS